MDKHIISFFENNKLQLKNKTIVIAVSTGIDSMVLLHSFIVLKEKYNLKIIVAHYNHQKRDQSSLEEAFINEFCFNHDINCFVEKLEQSTSLNFQSYARDQRYQFFKKVLEQVNGDYLLLAHHAVDNMETMIMRIIRGSNLKGYAGMESISAFNNKLILRPFLNILKNYIIEYANLHKIKYFEDASNKDDIYTRNRIRKEMIPIFFSEDKNVHLKFQELSLTLREANFLLEKEVKCFTDKCQVGKSFIGFNIDEFLLVSNFIQIEIIFSILKKYYLSKQNVLEIIKIINSEKKNIKTVYKEKFTIVKEYQNIYFYFEKLEKKQINLEIKDLGHYKLNDTISINVTKKSNAYILNPCELCYNSSMLPIRIRTRKNGDKILLESGYKKVKDLLIDQKVGIIKRDEILIMEKDSDILAVLGIRKSILLKQIENNDIVIKVENNNNG